MFKGKVSFMIKQRGLSHTHGYVLLPESSRFNKSVHI